MSENHTEALQNGTNIPMEQVLCDTIFGFISLKPYILVIIDTVEFQRLRCIWQLGLTPFIYPTASYSRFEHSIGTYHLASLLVTKLKKQLEVEHADIRISDEELKCVEIAALCHELGQGPFSRVWDNIILPNIVKGKTKRHHEHFSDIWSILKEKETIKNMLLDEKLSAQHEKLINALINGEETEGHEILRGIVHDSQSGLDVSKWDYLARDSKYLGHAYTNYRADIEHMIHFARAIKDDTGKWKIAFRDSERLNIARVFELRHYIHQTACRHRTVIAIELMMLDGFRRYFDKDENRDLKSQIYTATWLIENNDSIFWSNIKHVPEFQRIMANDLYRPIFEAVIYRYQENPKKAIKNKMKENEIFTTNKLKNYKFGFCKYKLCHNSEDPMSAVPLYSNKDINRIIRYCDKDRPLCRVVDESRVIVFSINSKENVDEENVVKKELSAYFDRMNADIREADNQNCVEWKILKLD